MKKQTMWIVAGVAGFALLTAIFFGFYTLFSSPTAWEQTAQVLYKMFIGFAVFAAFIGISVGSFWGAYYFLKKSKVQWSLLILLVYVLSIVVGFLLLNRYFHP